MNAPQHALILKRHEWAEQTTVRSFINGAGTPDGDDVMLMLDMLKDHWERLIDSMPHHAQDEAHEALDKIIAAWVAVSKALDEAECDPVSDDEDFRALDDR